MSGKMFLSHKIQGVKSENEEEDIHTLVKTLNLLHIDIKFKMQISDTNILR